MPQPARSLPKRATPKSSIIRWGTGLPRQFQYERTQSRIGGSIWQYPTRFIENSPIFWADKVQTPVMLLHNDSDDAVPWYQGIEFYLALRRLGKEVYLFVYNGEPHGLRRRPDQKDYTIRLQQYFDHYLKGAPAPDWMTSTFWRKPGLAVPAVPIWVATFILAAVSRTRRASCTDQVNGFSQ